MRFNGKIAFVTGAAQGIGEAVAARLVREGLRVIIGDINSEKVALTASALDPSGEKVKGIACNVSDPANVEEVFKWIQQEYGQLDYLVNNAGITRDALATKMSLEQWDAVLTVNLRGSFMCAREAARLMIPQNYGKIVNLSSVAVHGNMGQSNYSAAKAGIVGLTKTLAKELGQYNINVNCVQPGYTLTPMTEVIPEKVKEHFIKQIPLRRASTPDEQAGVITFLLSEESAYITGKALEVDGGLFM